MYWGLTPALDLQELYKNHCSPPKEYNILLIGSTDARHILKTISQCYRHEPIQINFYVMDAALELVARQLLLINIALQPFKSLGLMLKTKLFMELYGNSLVRPGIAKYLTNKAKHFVEMITNMDYCHEMMSLIDLNDLKYKERDHLEVLFKYWSANDKFLICDLWERRLRRSLGVRYDSRLGVFDWDLHMRLHSLGAKQICPQEYKHWRETGVAFTWLENEVSKPNRTLVAGVVPSGEKFLHHGYLGDIVSGPYYAYGLQCKDKEMLKEMNQMNINRATDITEYNLTQMFYEIQYKEECNYKNNSNIHMGTIVVDLPNKHVIDSEDLQLETKPLEIETKCIDIENVKINFVSYSKLDRICYQPQKFNIIYYSYLFIDKINPEMIKTNATDQCLLIIENQKFMPSLRKEQLEELETKIKDKISGVSATQLPFNSKEDCYSMFVIN